MTIKISRQLTNNQYIKLFSNPISGIVCESKRINCMELPDRERLWNIRYSKSMILRALYFWEKQCDRYNQLLKRAQFNPLFRSDNNRENEILKLIMMVHSLPDSFLYSHRYIESYDRNNKHTQAMTLQLKLLHTKYHEFISNLKFQKQKMDPFTFMQAPYGIEFTVFPNEHPYIHRAIIAEVGQTSKGNTFIVKKKK